MIKPLQISTILFLAASLSHGAVITWGVATAISSPIDVSTNGTLVEAINLSHDSQDGVVTTVNGVGFTGVSSILSNNNATNLNPNNLGGDADYDTILSNFDFGGNNTENISVGGGSLVLGDTYEVQVWYVDDRTNQDARIMTVSDGIGVGVDLNDEYLIGTFVADGTNQNIQVVGGGNVNVHLNAYQVRNITNVIPEPSSSALFGLGALALFIRRRR